MSSPLAGQAAASPRHRDCLIAATAIAGDHELFAVDGDFEDISKHAPLRLYCG